jgi:hypothetical protein
MNGNEAYFVEFYLYICECVYRALEVGHAIEKGPPKKSIL